MCWEQFVVMSSVFHCSPLSLLPIITSAKSILSRYRGGDNRLSTIQRSILSYSTFRTTTNQWRRQDFRLGGRTLPCPIPPLSFPFPLPSHLSLPLISSPLSSPPLRSRPPEVQLGGLGERCKLPQRGLGRSFSRNRIWCIFASKYDICWQQFS